MQTNLMRFKVIIYCFAYYTLVIGAVFTMKNIEVLFRLLLLNQVSDSMTDRRGVANVLHDGKYEYKQEKRKSGV